ncbi:LDLR chaperone boca-like isoform X1 [Paramacrobiotus metropolitanus]|uniref:LDLR chaperone boca-like isoform X1 n=2 Tax=Paramacrobiotus metropolitanus TaxID=2943436 RepID=UPI0024465924|nr:LDLR chaperone boca-like isoform X1 [Paramacrobiotus metropolitanus]
MRMRYLPEILRCICIASVLTGVIPLDRLDENDNPKPAKKKSILDYNDVDMERIYEQWEKDEEPLEPDELPEHLRPSPKIDLSKLDTSDPESIIKMTKKGKTLMMFVTVSGNPDKSELERITGLWHTSLFNMHIESQRFVVDASRAIFMFKDGAQAWEAKDFLVEQDQCKEVVIENKSYPGKHFETDNTKDEL